MPSFFAAQVFFIIFCEVLEAAIIISVLLSFLKQCLGQPDQDPKIYKRLVCQVWAGALSGIAVCLVVGGTFIGVFYGLGKNLWSKSEDLWEGIFYLVATVIITAMGLALLRINKTKENWRVKIAQALVDKAKHDNARSRLGAWSRRYALFLLPFITTMREGVEGVVFVGGVSLSLKASAFPIPVITGILAGLLVGYLIYRGGNVLSIQLFLIASTCVLYLIAAGMFSKAVWAFQFHSFAQKVGGDVAEVGNGPGSYNIRDSVWHVNCCSPYINHGWDVFNALLGWQNSATYGSIIAYNVYWIGISFTILCLLYEERTGSLPLKASIVKAMLAVPGLRSYVKRKRARAISDAGAAELVRQGKDHLKTGVFAETEKDMIVGK
jgi:high-affinity iron transporter